MTSDGIQIFLICGIEQILSLSNLYFSSRFKGPRINEEKPCFITLNKVPLPSIRPCPYL
jgi:hypothetical protein